MRLPQGTHKSKTENLLITPTVRGTHLMIYPRSVVIVSKSGSLCLIFNERGILPGRPSVKLPGMGRVVITNAQELISTFYRV